MPVSESSLDPLSFCDFKCVPPFELHEVTDNEVTTRIVLMDPKKAKGEDGIHVQFLRHLSIWYGETYVIVIANTSQA